MPSGSFPTFCSLHLSSLFAVYAWEGILARVAQVCWRVYVSIYMGEEMGGGLAAAWGNASTNSDKATPFLDSVGRGVCGLAHSSPIPLPQRITAVKWEVWTEARKVGQSRHENMCPWASVGGSKSTLTWQAGRDPVAQLPASERQPWRAPKHTSALPQRLCLLMLWLPASQVYKITMISHMCKGVMHQSEHSLH